MKKILAVFLATAACIALCACGTVVNPPEQTTTGSKIEKVYEVDGTVLKNCKGQSDKNGVFVVPDGITEIGEGAFSGDTEIKEVVLHDGIVKIGEGAFYSAISLEKVTFGKGLKTIGGGAFQYCESLKTLELPEGLEEIGAKAFYQCSALKSISLPSTLKLIDSYAFALCTRLPELTIPDNVSFIGNCAFQACWLLTDVTLPKSLKRLNYQTFAGCKLLENINFAKDSAIEEIGPYAFWQCKELRKITLPEGLSKIEKYAFYDCGKLDNVSVPSTLTDSGEYAFDGTPWYSELADDYVVVGDGVLIKCNIAASSLDLSGKGIKTIGGCVFRNSTYYGGVDSYGVATSYGYAQAEMIEKLVIPEGVKKIGNSAFDACSITELTLPSTLEYIGDYAFYNAILWKSDEISGNVVFTDVDMTNCKKLARIGSYAFTECYGLAEIKLPSDEVEIGTYAFFKTEAMVNFLKNAYLNNRNENSFFTVGNTLICAYVAKSSTSVTIPDGIVRIAGTALIGWDSGLVITEDPYEEVSDPEMLFDRNRYYLGYNITSVTIPDSVKYIDDQAFYSMRALKEIKLSPNTVYIGEAAFMNCYGLETVALGKSLVKVADKAFQYCHELVSVTFPETLKSIGSDVFDGCTSLAKVVLPVGTTDIGFDIFSADCLSLKDIYIAPEFKTRIFGVVGDLYMASNRGAMNIHYYIKH